MHGSPTKQALAWRPWVSRLPRCNSGWQAAEGTQTAEGRTHGPGPHEAEARTEIWALACVSLLRRDSTAGVGVYCKLRWAQQLVGGFSSVLVFNSLLD